MGKLERPYVATRKGYSDGIKRAAIGVFIRLSENQVDALEKLAGDASLGEYLQSVGEAAIQRMIPALKSNASK